MGLAKSKQCRKNEAASQGRFEGDVAKLLTQLPDLGYCRLKVFVWINFSGGKLMSVLKISFGIVLIAHQEKDDERQGFM